MIPDFLDALWPRDPNLFGELRVIHGPKQVVQTFYPLDDAADLIALLPPGVSLGGDVYFGVLPRRWADGRADAVVTETSVLWADIDAKRFEGGKPGALLSLNALPIAPQVVVDSGGGYHAYWLLSQPVPVELAKPVMIWIADEIGGDHVQDASRVLRLPGTLNLKYQPPVMARILKFDTMDRIRFADLDTLVPLRYPSERGGWAPPADDMGHMPEWLEKLIVDGVPKGQRSEAIFKAIIWMIRYGWGRNAIANLLHANEQGLGAKLAEQGAGWERYFARTYQAAELEA